MDRLRPGDVSPTATSPDEYRAQHDVSPLSPLAEDDAQLPRRDASRRWRTFQAVYFDVSPESSENGQQEWTADPNAQSPSVYSQDSPLGTRAVWPTEIRFGREPQLALQDPALAVPEEERRVSREALQVASEDGWRKQAPRDIAATAIRSSDLQCTYWSPIWFRDYFLISLSIGCAVVAVVVFALYLTSSKSLGLGSYVGPTDLVYLWKFIPTTVMVILLALWKGVDFTARLLQPWANLRSGPASAERSIFLDLITPIWPVLFKKSIRSGSYVPILTVSGVVILNIATVLSTGLLHVDTVDLTDGNSSSAHTTAVDATWDPGGKRDIAARQDILSSARSDIQDRIQVKIGSAAPVITLLLVCLGLSIIILFKRPQEIVPRDPRSIGGTALLLKCNPELSYHFRSNLSHLRYHLQHERFLTLLPKKSDFKFAIVREAMNPTFLAATGSVQDRENPTWWQPVPLTVWYKTLSIVLPLALIGALEGVQQVSDHSNGIAAVASPGTAHYAITIIPALVMWGVNMLYASINFNTVLFAPYYALSQGSNSNRSLFSHNLGRVAVMQFASSLKQRHVAAACTALAATIAPWLTIIVSGLYSTTNIDNETKITQNHAPKLALQVLLGVIALCLAASWLSMRTNGLLPHNPCSIAGMAALLAGGELWKGRDEERRGLAIPEGAEWMSDRELKKREIWNDSVFGLGWWPDGRYGIDAGGRIDGD